MYEYFFNKSMEVAKYLLKYLNREKTDKASTKGKVSNSIISQPTNTTLQNSLSVGDSDEHLDISL